MLFDLTILVKELFCIYTYLLMCINIFKEGFTKNKIGNKNMETTYMTTYLLRMA